MKILDARVRWRADWSNAPSFELWVDRIPMLEELRFMRVDSIYYARDNGYARFFAYPAPGDGYGGRTFSITMGNDAQKDLVGPWSSRSGCVNARFDLHCTEAGLVTDVESFLKGYTFYAGAITIPLAVEAAKMCGVYLLKTSRYKNKEIYYTPSHLPERVTKVGNVRYANRTFTDAIKVLDVVYSPKG